jgi:hypothetical protein
MAADTTEFSSRPLGQPRPADPPCHRCEDYPPPAGALPDISEDDETTRPHAHYNLSPPLPGTPIPSGGSYRASRVWVVVDLLLTSGTLRHAIEQSKIIAGS